MRQPRFALRILVITCVAHCVTHMVLLLFTAVKHEMSVDLGVGKEDIASVFALTSVFFGLGAVPSGWLSDRLGERSLMVAFFFLCAVGTLLIGISHSAWVLVAGGIVLGLATSIYHPVANALISKGVEARGRAMGINGIAGSLGTALGPAFDGLIGADSWRTSFLVVTIPCVFLGLMLCFLDLGPASRPVDRQASDAARTEKGTSESRSLLVRLFGFLLTAMTLGGFFYYMFTTILPEYVSWTASDSAENSPIDARAGGLAAGLILVIGTVGQMVGGVLSDRYDGRVLYVCIYAILIPLVLPLAYLSGTTALVLAAAASTVYFAVQPVENHLIAQYTPAAWKGRIFGLKFILVFSIGGGLGTRIAVDLEQGPGVPLVFLVSAVALSVALACTVVASRIKVARADH